MSIVDAGPNQFLYKFSVIIVRPCGLKRTVTLDARDTLDAMYAARRLVAREIGCSIDSLAAIDITVISSSNVSVRRDCDATVDELQ